MSVSRRTFLGLLATMPLACAKVPEPSSDDDIVDLTHMLSPSSPYIPVKDATFPFRREPIATIPERGVYANRWELTEHIGTHIDAPCHFSTRASCLEATPLEDLFAEAVVVDVRERAKSQPDTELTLEDLSRWEATYGPIPDRCAVLLRSGWDARWPSQERFTNTDAAGVMHFPGFSLAAIQRLAAATEVLGVGVDTLSIDPGRDVRYQGHRVLAEAGKWALECLANLASLPPRGARIFVGALKVEGASGSPARIIAWVPRNGGS